MFWFNVVSIITVGYVNYADRQYERERFGSLSFIKAEKQ